MEQVIKELQKLVDSWKYQKDNNLKPGKECDIHIECFQACIQLINQANKSSRKTKTE